MDVRCDLAKALRRSFDERPYLALNIGGFPVDAASSAPGTKRLEQNAARCGPAVDG